MRPGLTAGALGPSIVSLNTNNPPPPPPPPPNIRDLEPAGLKLLQLLKLFLMFMFVFLFFPAFMFFFEVNDLNCTLVQI